MRFWYSVRMRTVVSAKGLSVEFGDGYKALDNVHLELPAGKITGLIGPSGAAKRPSFA